MKDFDDIHVVIHFVDLAAEIYQSYSLRMTLRGLKDVGMT
jgi:hypothetical protein